MIDATSKTEEAIANIYNKYGNMIYRLSYTYLHSAPDAEDIVQDTLIAYMKNSQTFSGAEHEKAWLMRVAINLCKNKLKSHWRKTVEIPDTLQADEIPEEEMEVLSAVQKLPVKYREVVHLFYYEGYSTSDISTILDKKESTVRSLLHRSRKALKNLLEGAYDFEE